VQSLVEPCKWCQGAVEALRAFNNWFGSAYVGLKAQLAHPGTPEGTFQIRPATLVVTCSQCKEKRQYLTAEGRQLVELYLAENVKPVEENSP
jgi:hypothetical protein